MKTLTRAAAALLLASVAWACESAPLAAPAEARLDEADRAPVVNPIDVQAATLTWLIDNKGAAGFDAYCVSVGENDDDPSAELLDRFAGRTPPVVPLSHCTVSVTGDTYNPTGGPAQWFFLRDPVVTGRTAELDAGFHINGRLAEFFHCTLRLTGQGWVVRECVLTGAA
ncbi:MAG TPA: hypothetical protein VHG91_16265 [Longimicrobium sp.]|nr:hypothetical protein [Longimicrobium sp.]